MSGPAHLRELYERDREARWRSQTVFERPLVLEAGAGTGKTAALVARTVTWCLGPGWERTARELDQQNRDGGVTTEAVAARVLDGVVAITFTEAAAAEMAAKIGQALADVAGDRIPVWVDRLALPADTDERKARAAALVVALDHLLVATIHAFCRRLLATVPLDAGLHPGFAVDAEGSVLAEVVQTTVEAAFRQALGQSGGEDLLDLAALGKGPLEVTEVLTTLVNRGMPPEALFVDPLAPDLVEDVARQVRDQATALHELLDPCLSGSKKAKNAAEITHGLDGLVRTLKRGQPPTVTALQAALAEALPERLVTHLAGWGKGKFNGTETEALAGATAEVRRLAARLARLAGEMGALDAELLDLARRALAPLLAEVQSQMRARGAETFAALLRDARDTLAHNPAVCARKRAEITQLLVDEFQDTDRVQCEILRLLALEGPEDERPGLFLIGDPKQSIYGWRNADLAAYDDFLALVRERGGEVLTLAVNFRSLPAILEEVERSIAPAMRRERGVQPAFEGLLPFEGRVADQIPSSGPRSPVEYWVSWERSEEEPYTAGEGNVREALELEARAVARDIRELHDAGEAMWHEFGVLMRATGDLDAYLQALRDADVPYVVERDRSYYRRREIIEAAALVRTVLDPGDHLALLTVLRSALAGVPDAALIPLWASGFPDRVSELSSPTDRGLAELRAVVLDVAGKLPSDVPGLARVRGWEHALLAFLGNLAALREAFEAEPAAVFLERLRTLTLLEAGEAARTLGVYRIANLDRFFRALLTAMEEGSGDPYAMLRALRSNVEEEREAEEGRPLAAAEDAVRVMTIHKAKGLDFTHTYLVQAHRKSRGDVRATSDAEEFDGRFEYVLFGAATPGWFRVVEHRRQVGAAEMVRTLYVAMTRARDRLVVAGNWPSGQPPVPPRSHLDLLSPRLPGEGLPAVAARIAAGGSHFADEAGVRWVFPAFTAAAEEAPRVPAYGAGLASVEEIACQAEALASLRHGASARMARPFSAPASEEAHRLLRELLAGRHVSEEQWVPGPSAATEASPAIAAGGLVHRVLEELDLSADLAAGLAGAHEQLPRYLEGLVGREGLREALERARSILERLAGSDVLKRLKAVAPDVVARELPVLLPPGGGPDAPVAFVSGTIDLVYRDARSGQLVIVDYKTDDVATDEEVAERVTAYAPQGVAYRRALREALALESDPRFELWFLQADRIAEVRG